MMSSKPLTKNMAYLIRRFTPSILPAPGTCPLSACRQWSRWAATVRVMLGRRAGARRGAAHLIAPYAKILITATPADSEIADDAASQVAPPEMMQALETIAHHHLADVISISDGTAEST